MDELFLPGFSGRSHLYDDRDTGYADGGMGIACMAAGTVHRIPYQEKIRAGKLVFKNKEI